MNHSHQMPPEGTPADAFIARWQGREGGQKRANYALFLSELCDALGVPRPQPASASTEANDYVFERVVKEPAADGTFSSRRIDLYKRGCFVLEAKQSRQTGGPKEVVGQTDLFPKPAPIRRGARGASRSWDVLMMNARQQAEAYARALPVEHGWPPFVLVCDVGHVIEVFADFSGQGKNYVQFPDRQSFRVFLDDLRDPAIRERLRQIWIDPRSLDPARKSARVTREIAERLAAVSKALEGGSFTPEDVAMFLMRCLFTMFAAPRAAAIAELVLWIGHLQWHLRTKGGMPSEPILKAFHNIMVKDAVLEAEEKIARDQNGKPVTHVGPDGATMEVYDYLNPRRPDWPEAEFIVGNPPFIGKGEPMRAAFGQSYLDALWSAHPKMNESADFVLYWWDHAAELLTREATALRRFGFVTTNSITQIFNRRVIERHLQGEKPISFVLAIPDHPWTKATRDAAAVRIAMTVGEAGRLPGVLNEVIYEGGLDTDQPTVMLRSTRGDVNPDLTVGVDLTSAEALNANKGLASMGIPLSEEGALWFLLPKVSSWLEARKYHG